MLNQLSRHSFWNDFLFMMMGFFVFSSLGSTIMQDYLNFPISMPELVMVPFLFLLRGKLFSIRFKSKDFVIATFIIIALLLIGIVWNEFPIYAMLSSSRSWFYLFVCLFAFSRPNKINCNDLLWLSFGSIVAWLVDSMVNYQKAIEFAVAGEQYVTYGLMLAVPIFCSLAIKRAKYLLLILGIAIISITVVFAGIRRLLVVLLLSLVVALVFSLIAKKKSIVPYAIVSVLFGAMVMATLPIIREYVYETSPVMYYRVFERTENYLETGNSGSRGDESRMKHFEDFFGNIAEYTIPHGMVSLQTKQDKKTGVFNDFPLYQLSWIFSWPITCLILFYLFLILFRNIRKFKKNKDGASLISIDSIITMLMLMFLEGTYIEYPYATPITGLLLGRAWLNAKSSKLLIN